MSASKVAALAEMNWKHKELQHYELFRYYWPLIWIWDAFTLMWRHCNCEDLGNIEITRTRNELIMCPKWNRRYKTLYVTQGVCYMLFQEMRVYSYVDINLYLWLNKIAANEDVTHATFSVIEQDRYDVIKWKHFPLCWSFVWGIRRSPVNSPTQASDAELRYFLWSALE